MHLRGYAVIGAPDIDVIGFGPFLGDLETKPEFAHAKAMRIRNDTQRIRNDTQKMTAAFGRYEHVSVQRGVGHLTPRKPTFKIGAYKLVNSAGKTERQFGHARTRPRRGSVDVKFT